jgi:alpha-tubulin suppressor-like RCC1 family protein
MACSDSGGKVCDGGGHCVGCNTSADCGGICNAGTCVDPVAIAVPGGFFHTCAILSDGTLWCWGANVTGEVGDGTTQLRSSPTQVNLSGAVTAVSASGTPGTTSYLANTCAIRADKSLWCWGDNSFGQLGVGDTNGRTGPQAVKLPNSVQVVQVAVGGGQVCAVDTGANLWCWGANKYGQIGNGNTTNATTPSQVASSIASVSAGFTHTCAVSTGGALTCWGSDTWGELGNGTTTGSNANTAPVPVSSLTGVAEVSAGVYTTCARTGTSVSCWGLNNDGQLGIGNTSGQTSPFSVTLPGVKLLAQGGHTAGAVTSSGLFMWGSNLYGQLGDGSNTDEHSPESVNFASAAALDVGEASACALTTPGLLYCWGSNENGQLGNGTMNDSKMPARVVWQ